MVKKVASDVMERGDDQVEDLVTKPGEYVDKFAKSKHGKNIGSWAFIIGFVIAMIAGLIAGIQAIDPTFMMNVDIVGSTAGLLVVIGLIVGLVNVSGKESISFLIAAIAMSSAPAAFGAMMQALPQASVVLQFLGSLTGAIAAFVAPAAVVVALKVIYSTGRQA